eukprot:NODE_1137_length_2056_cov_0.948901.p1 type:complete len:365 gc:universal NODE_1137_length_2056_cov_0.948901:1164-70(-)
MQSIYFLITLSYADLMLDLVNTQRKLANAQPLKLDALCVAAAKEHTLDQSTHQFMGHVGSDGTSVGDRLSRLGFKWDAVAENVAEGQKSVEEVMTAWMNSAGHRENLLNPNYDRFGYFESTGSDGKIYWTQTFSHPTSDYKPIDIDAPIPGAPQAPKSAAPATPATPAVVTPTKSSVASIPNLPKISIPIPQPTQSSPKSPASSGPTPVTPPPAIPSSPASLASAHKNVSSPAISSPPASPTSSSSPIANPTDSSNPNSQQESLPDVLLSFQNLKIPQYALNLLPKEIQDVAQDIPQYCQKVVAYLHDKIPSADPNAHYFTNHPGLKSTIKYAKNSYAEYSDGFEGSPANSLSWSFIVLSYFLY